MHGDLSFIERIIQSLANAGITHIIINVSWLKAQIVERLGDKHHDIPITYSDEGEIPLGTGGGIKRALPYLGDQRFLVINADVYTDWCPDRLCPLAPHDLAHLILTVPPDGAHGDFSLDHHTVIPGKDWTFCGIGYYSPDLFRRIGRDIFPLTDVLHPAIRKQRVSGQVYRGRWLDIGTPAALEKARRLE